MRNIFLDLGAHDGNTLIKAFKCYPDFDLFVCFEPIPCMVQKIKRSVPDNKGYKIVILEKDFKIDNNLKHSVIISNSCVDNLKNKNIEETTFYISRTQNGIGSSLLPDKRMSNNPKKIKSIVFDIRYIFNQLVKEGDQVVLKLDIEGKEYDVLDALIESKLLNKYVNKIFSEWHYHKTKTITEERHNELIEKLKNMGFDVSGGRDDAFYWE